MDNAWDPESDDEKTLETLEEEAINPNNKESIGEVIRRKRANKERYKVPPPALSLEECQAAVRKNVNELLADPLSFLPSYTTHIEETLASLEAQTTALTEALAAHDAAAAEAASAEPDSAEAAIDPSATPQPPANRHFPSFSSASSHSASSSGAASAGESFSHVSAGSEPTGSAPDASHLAALADRTTEYRRKRQFALCLSADHVDLETLRRLSWKGVPPALRAVVWSLLMGYLPAPRPRRLATLARKRQEYCDAVRLAFGRGDTALDAPIWHQIQLDVPRTHPTVRLWQCPATRRSLERILYVWAIRHPASGYVQGINDLATPFFEVFLAQYLALSSVDAYDVAGLPDAARDALEADTFWSLSKLLDGIQDNYIFAQPGIQRQVARMRALCVRVDAPLSRHLDEQGVEFIQFAFRWINCLLMRELKLRDIIRMWDTYLSEGTDAFSDFHTYVCLAFLTKWSSQLREMDFQGMIMFLQSLPTQDWTEQDIELLLSEAFMWSRTFQYV